MGSRVLQKTLQRACVALAAEQIGGAQRCLEISVEYAKLAINSDDRSDRSRPSSTVRRHAGRRRGRAFGRLSRRVHRRHGDDEELALAASTAKAFCSEAFFRCAAETIQVHGGIGFTWEHDAHLYFKRAKASESLFGDPAHHGAIVATKIGL